MNDGKSTKSLKKMGVHSFSNGRRYSFCGLQLTKPQWYVLASVVGGLALAPLGGIGIAAFGGAIGIGWWVVGAIAGWLTARNLLKSR